MTNTSQSDDQGWNARVASYVQLTGGATVRLGEMAISELNVRSYQHTFFRMTSDQLDENSIVHDNAAGPGVEIEGIQKRAGGDVRIEVTDFSEAFIEVANGIIKEKKLKNVHAHAMDSQVTFSLFRKTNTK